MTRIAKEGGKGSVGIPPIPQVWDSGRSEKTKRASMPRVPAPRGVAAA